MALNKGPEAFGLADATLGAQGGNNAGESLLAQLLHGLRSAQAGAQLDPQKSLKIRDKVLLGGLVKVAQAVDVRFVKRKKLHESSPQLIAPGV